ncbi:MAG: hypothetical protein AAF266_06645, partial [Planctomycetota bacterium]
IDRNGWTQLTLLDSTPADNHDGAALSLAVLDQLADCPARLAVSQGGMQQLAKLLAARRRGQLEIGRGLIPRWAWPTGFGMLVEQLAPYAPLAEQLGQLDEPVALGFRGESDGAWTASLLLPIRTKPSEATIPAMTTETPIATLRLAGQLPTELVDLAIAFSRCRPDEIDAPEYPQPQWDDYAEACRQLADGFLAANCVLTLPGEGEPVATNQVATFLWGGAQDQLGDALALVTVRWNQLIDAAEARTPLRVAIEPLKESAGWRLSTDLFTGFDVERSPEIEALFDRYYGGETLSLDVSSVGDAIWRASLGTEFDSSAGVGGKQLQSGGFLSGEFHLDRWFAWQRQIEDITMGDALGHRVRPTMAVAPPATLRARLGDTLRIDATLPAATYEAAVDYWRAEKVKP